MGYVFRNEFSLMMDAQSIFKSLVQIYTGILKKKKIVVLGSTKTFGERVGHILKLEYGIGFYPHCATLEVHFSIQNTSSST